MDEIISFIRENPVCYLATADGAQPRVRAFLAWKADKSGVHFDTADYKDTYKQLRENPLMEACFYDGKKMLRLSGKVEFSEDAALRKEYFGEKPDNPKTVFFRLAHGKALMWWRDESGKSQKQETEF
jgi:pyridoxamine 5'-phosphate oxidase